MTNQRFKNRIRKTQTIDEWRANMQRNTQRKVIYENMLKTHEKLQNAQKPETGTTITYNIQDLKLYPGKLQNIWISTHETTNANTDNATKLGPNRENDTRRTYDNIPTQGKTQIRKDTDWVNKQKIWSTPQEQQTMEYMITKRRNLQTRLAQLKKEQRNNSIKSH